MRVLVVGAGGREHALALAFARDPSVTAVHVAPGNAGTAAVATNHPVVVTEAGAVASLAVRLGVGLVVVGPDAAIAAGVADAVTAAGVPCFGASAAAGRLESSKAFAKQVMAAAGVPTAESLVASESTALVRALDRFGPPHVVKHDGLAAGKGVVVTGDRAAAVAHAELAFAHGAEVVVEEFLDGPEMSLFCVCDGRRVVPLLPAQDFKRLGDGDAGPNTGGMGAYAPLPWLPPGLVADVVTTVAEPTVAEMAARRTPFVGLLYIGLALTSRGTRVVEFNARFGDPETQVVLPLLESPLAPLLLAAATGDLDTMASPVWRPGAAVAVVLASAGYPGTPRTGDRLTGLAAAEDLADVTVVHAGTSLGPDGGVLSSGGRVLAVTALAADVATARALAYRGIAGITLPGGHHRSDIAAEPFPIAAEPFPIATAPFPIAAGPLLLP